LFIILICSSVTDAASCASASTQDECANTPNFFNGISACLWCFDPDNSTIRYCKEVSTCLNFQCTYYLDEYRQADGNQVAPLDWGFYCKAAPQWPLYAIIGGSVALIILGLVLFRICRNRAIRKRQYDPVN